VIWEATFDVGGWEWRCGVNAADAEEAEAKAWSKLHRQGFFQGAIRLVALVGVEVES
jgi:hypothetical protein